jgi:hypothetical protein
MGRVFGNERLAIQRATLGMGMASLRLRDVINGNVRDDTSAASNVMDKVAPRQAKAMY